MRAALAVFVLAVLIAACGPPTLPTFADPPQLDAGPDDDAGER